MKYLVAPDYEHHISMTPWHKEYPQAKVIGVEGLDEKKKKEDIKFDVIFTKDNKHTLKVDEEFDKEFDVEYVPSHGNKVCEPRLFPEMHELTQDRRSWWSTSRGRRP